MAGKYVASPHTKCSGYNERCWLFGRLGDAGRGRCSVLAHRDCSATIQHSNRLGLCHAQSKDDTGGEDEIDIDEIVRKLSSEASIMRQKEAQQQAAAQQRFEAAEVSMDVCSPPPSTPHSTVTQILL